VSLSVQRCRNSPSRPFVSQTWKRNVCYDGIKQVREAAVIPFFLAALNVCGCVLPIGSSKSSITKTHSVSEGWIPAPTSSNRAVNLANVNWCGNCTVGDSICWLKNDHLSTSDGRKVSGGPIYLCRHLAPWLY